MKLYQATEQIFNTQRGHRRFYLSLSPCFIVNSASRLDFNRYATLG
ncbi:hypothetical protein [Gloeocapsa sp. PCC 7428]|nr:hypothetical protein [Gloeocapsa sp. PCC 7428]